MENPTPPADAGGTPTPTRSPTGKALLPVPNWLLILCLAAAPALAGVAAAPGVPNWLRITAAALGASAAVIAAMSPGLRDRGGAAAIVALAASLALLHPFPAQAQALSMGPAAPLMAISPGDKNPVAFSPGTGFQVSCDLLETKLNGQPVHWFSPGGAILGTASSNGTTTALGIIAALNVAILHIFTVGIGAPLITSEGNGLFQHPDKRTPLIMFGLDHGLAAVLQAFGIGHAPPAAEPAPADAPVDGDHPHGVPPESPPSSTPAPTGAAK